MKTKNYLTTLLIVIFAMNFTEVFGGTASKIIPSENQESTETIIESLQNGEEYSIEITSIGCFHGNRETIVISKESDVFTVQYQDFSKILSTEDIEAFIRFELQLKALQIGGCTTIDTYVIRYKGEEFRTSDGTCSWLGGKKLLKAIS
jgi:hypothetical protein